MKTERAPFIHRRHFLRGLGMALALPAFDSLNVGLAASTPKPDPRRLICIGNHLGFWPGGFFPTAEGRDYRSPNELPDGPDKSLWGAEQREWLKATLKSSDAKWKMLISPTPMVGPDDFKKIDNHADLSGFRHEAVAFFAWLKENQIGNFKIICGDRHWQYHSIHSTGVEEFACGALNDENARLGVAPGAKNGSDPQGLIKQEYTSPTPNDGFLQVTAGAELVIEHFNSRGKRLYRSVK